MGDIYERDNQYVKGNNEIFKILTCVLCYFAIKDV